MALVTKCGAAFSFLDGRLFSVCDATRSSSVAAGSKQDIQSQIDRSSTTCTTRVARGRRVIGCSSCHSLGNSTSSSSTMMMTSLLRKSFRSSRQLTSAGFSGVSSPSQHSHILLSHVDLERNRFAFATNLSRRSNQHCRDLLPPSSATTSTSSSSSSTLTETEELNNSDPDLGVKLERFWQWTVQNGAVNPSKIVARPSQLGAERIGLLAERSLSSFDEVLAIPESLCITLETARSSPIGSFCKDFKPWVQLAVFLIYEIQKSEKSESMWKPYLDILPRHLDLPLFWADAELAELQGTQLLDSCLNYRQYIQSEYATLLQEVIAPNPDIFDAEVFSEEAFTWAFGILRSRAHPPFTGESIALVPLADFLNHGSIGTGKTTWGKRSQGLFNKQQVVSMNASRSYETGQQIRMEYGKDKSNSVLALEYGFVEPLVDSDTNDGQIRNRQAYTLTLEIDEEDRFFDDKADVAEVAGMSGPRQEFNLVKGEEPPAEMITFLRLMAMDGPDAFLLEALFRNTAWDLISLPVSRENEEGVCRAMIDGSRTAIAGYNTTVDEDWQLLQTTSETDSMSYRKKMAVIVRLGEKQVLLETLEYFEERLANLDKLEYYAERRLKDIGLLDDGGSATPWVFNE